MAELSSYILLFSWNINTIYREEKFHYKKWKMQWTNNNWNILYSNSRISFPVKQSSQVSLIYV